MEEEIMGGAWSNDEFEDEEEDWLCVYSDEDLNDLIWKK
jgi:hypothetical protein